MRPFAPLLALAALPLVLAANPTPPATDGETDAVRRYRYGYAARPRDVSPRNDGDGWGRRRARGFGHLGERADSALCKSPRSVSVYLRRMVYTGERGRTSCPVRGLLRDSGM